MATKMCIYMPVDFLKISQMTIAGFFTFTFATVPVLRACYQQPVASGKRESHRPALFPDAFFTCHSPPSSIIMSLLYKSLMYRTRAALYYVTNTLLNCIEEKLQKQADRSDVHGS